MELLDCEVSAAIKYVRGLDAIFRVWNRDILKHTCITAENGNPEERFALVRNARSFGTRIRLSGEYPCLFVALGPPSESYYCHIYCQSVSIFDSVCILVARSFLRVPDIHKTFPLSPQYQIDLTSTPSHSLSVPTKRVTKSDQELFYSFRKALPQIP